MSPGCCSPVRPGEGRARSRARPSPLVTQTGCRGGLLDLDARAGCLQLLPRLVGLLLRDLLEDRLRRAVDEVLGLLQPKARQRAHLLDHLDLLVAGSRQDHVELRLLLRLLAAGSGAGAGHHHRGRGRRLHVEGLFERLDELRELEEVHLLELVEELISAQLRHRYSFRLRRMIPPQALLLLALLLLALLLRARWAASPCTPRAATGTATAPKRTWR